MDKIQAVKQAICKRHDSNKIKIYSNCNQEHADSYLVSSQTYKTSEIYDKSGHWILMFVACIIFANMLLNWI